MLIPTIMQIYKCPYHPYPSNRNNIQILTLATWATQICTKA